MKSMSKKVSAKRYTFSAIIIFFAMVLTVGQLVYFTGDPMYLCALLIMLPIIGINSVMQWNFDFTNATFKEKRKMAKELNHFGMD